VDNFPPRKNKKLNQLSLTDELWKKHHFIP